jgi:hypothetical protein
MRAQSRLSQSKERLCLDARFGVKPDFLLGGPHVRFRQEQTLVREGSPLVKLRNSAQTGPSSLRSPDASPAAVLGVVVVKEAQTQAA